MNAVIETQGSVRIVSKIKIEDPGWAALGHALPEGELRIAEVTFRTAKADESLRIAGKDFPTGHPGFSRGKGM